MIDGLPRALGRRVDAKLLAANKSNPLYVCELRALNNASLTAWLDADTQVRWWRKKRDNHPLQLRVGTVEVASVVSEWKRHLLVGTILSMPSSMPRPVCDVLAINMNAEEPATRMALQLDISRVMSLGREPPRSASHDGGDASSAPLLLMHGDAECRPPERYVALAWQRVLETCWRASWQKLKFGGDVVGATCTRSAGTRWCMGLLNTTSSCTRRVPLLRPDDPERCAPRDFVRFTDKALRWTVRVEARYFSLLPCGDDVSSATHGATVCLLFKNNIHEAWVGGVVSTTGGELFEGEPRLVMPAFNERAHRMGQRWGLTRSSTLTHNFAALRLPNGSYVLVGGRHRHPTVLFDGIWLAHGSHWMWNPQQQTSLKPVYRGQGVFLPLNITAPMQWRGLRRMLSGNHSGCVEARNISLFPQLAGRGVCEFDGRLSLAHLDGRYLLYARANRAALGGQRSVQVSTSTDLVRWSPFEPIAIRGHDVLSRAEGDVYFFLVHRNPVHARSLVAQFPLAHHGRACIGLALSLDGIRWSEVTPLLRCPIHGARAEHQPVGMALVPRRSAVCCARGEAAKKPPRGHDVAVFVHKSVPGILYDDRTPYRLSLKLRNIESRRGSASHLMRYRIPCHAFAQWTAAQIEELEPPATHQARATTARESLRLGARHEYAECVYQKNDPQTQATCWKAFS